MKNSFPHHFPHEVIFFSEQKKSVFSSLDTLEDMLNCTISNNSTLGNRLNVVLVEGLFPDQLDQLSPQVAERVGTAGEQRADVKFYLEVSPYFSVTNSHFITGCVDA